MRSVAELLHLGGRKVFLSGGAGHIGQAAAEALVELGATVAVADIDAAACAKTVETLEGRRPGSGIAVPCDLADERAAREAIRETVRALGGLDVLVHAAAYVGTSAIAGWAVPFERQTVDAWDAALRLNLTAAFVMVQEAKDALAASGHGSVIFFASIYGMAGPDPRLYADAPLANPAGYGASKGGLLQLTRHLATVLAPRIRVNAISPGGISRNQAPPFPARYEERTPLRRMGTEEDLKGAVAYLAGDASAYVTGHNLVVDGGWTAW